MVTIKANKQEQQLGYWSDKKLEELQAIRKSLYALHIRLDDILDWIMREKKNEN